MYSGVELVRYRIDACLGGRGPKGGGDRITGPPYLSQKCVKWDGGGGSIDLRAPFSAFQTEAGRQTEGEMEGAGTHRVASA